MSDELNLSSPGPAPSSKNPLEKIADWAKSRYGADPMANPQVAIDRDKGKDALGRFAGALGDQVKGKLAQGYSLANEASMGGYDAIVKAIGKASKSDVYQKLKDFKKNYQSSSDVGGAEGIAASMAVPGGTGLGMAAKGAKAAGLGKIASALGKGAEIASGAKKIGEGAGLLGRVGGAALKGGLLGAEQAVPRGITTAIGEGDLGKGAKEAAIGTLGGAALGGGLGLAGETLKGVGKLGRRFAEQQGVIRKSGDVIEPIEESLRKTRLTQLLPGFNARDLTKALNESASNLGIKSKAGYIVSNAEDLEKGLYDFAENTGIRNPKDFSELINGQGKLWESAYQKAADAGVRPIQAAKETLAAHPDMQFFLEDYGQEGQQFIDKLTKRIDRSGNDIRAVKATLDKEIKQAGKMGQFNSMYSDMQPILGDLKHSIDSSVMEFSPELATLKDTYPILKPLQKWAAKQETQMPAAKLGSDTAPKQLMSSLLSGAGPFAGMAVGGVPGALIGMAAGNAVNKALPKVTGFLKGELAGKALEALKNPKVAEALRSGISGVKGVADKVGEYAPKLAALAPRVAGAAPSILGRDEVQAEIDPKAEADTAAASVQDTEAQVEPDKVEEAKQETNSKWADRVNQNIGQAFYLYGLDQMGISLEEFQDAVRQATNDFDPKLSAEIVFDDDKERTAFLKDYDRALQYKAINVPEALTPSGFFGPSGEQKGSKEQLRGWLANLAGQDPMLMDDKKKKAIDLTIDRVAKMNGTQAEKQSALLRELQTNYGIDFARLSDLGLLGVV